MGVTSFLYGFDPGGKVVIVGVIRLITTLLTFRADFIRVQIRGLDVPFSFICSLVAIRLPLLILCLSQEVRYILD